MSRGLTQEQYGGRDVGENGHMEARSEVRVVRVPGQVQIPQCTPGNKEKYTVAEFSSLECIELMYICTIP